MNKLLLVLVLLSLSTSLKSQNHYEPFKLNDEGILYMDLVYENDSLLKKDLFNRSQKWVAKFFKDGKEVDMYSNEEEGTIIGKGAVKPKAGVLEILGGST